MKIVCYPRSTGTYSLRQRTRVHRQCIEAMGAAAQRQNPIHRTRQPLSALLAMLAGQRMGKRILRKLQFKTTR